MILGENIGSVFSGNREIQRVYSQGKLVWEKEEIDYSTIPFTVKAIDDNVSINLNTGSSSNVVSVKYSINRGAWVETDSKTTITITKNDTISIITTDILRCRITGLSDVYGNIMSLEYGDSFIGQTVWTKSYSSKGFFNNSDIRNAKNLILPATTLSNNAYAYMFAECVNLISAPVLPATTLAPYCYSNMFAGCSSLTKSPALPATTLAEGCYMEMFAGELSGAGVINPNNSKSGLTTAPALPATKLAEACYYGMFAGCLKLTTAPVLPATTLKDSCYFNMFAGCISLTTPPALLPAIKLADRCYAYMFYGCVSLTSAPTLPATTLAEGCYGWMFSYCSSLTTAPTLLATTLEKGCYSCMFSYCSKLNYIKCYATKIRSGVLAEALGELVIGVNSNYWVYWATDTATSGKLECKALFATAVKPYIPSTWTVKVFIL